MIKPSVSYDFAELFEEPRNGQIRVLCYGKCLANTGLENHHVICLAKQLGISVVLRPQTYTFNASVCEPEELNQVNLQTDGVEIWTSDSCLADGVVIPRGQMALFQTRDCPTIIVHNKFTSEVVGARAGRDSLIDRGLITSGNPSRLFASVVEAIVDRLMQHGSRPSDLEVFSCIAIGPTYFRHQTNDPVHGRFNQMMNRYIADHFGSNCFVDENLNIGALKLHRLIGSQFQKLGVPPDNIRNDNRRVNTYHHSDDYFSRRRKDEGGSNTILVINRQ